MGLGMKWFLIAVLVVAVLFLILAFHVVNVLGGVGGSSIKLVE